MQMSKFFGEKPKIFLRTAPVRLSLCRVVRAVSRTSVESRETSALSGPGSRGRRPRRATTPVRVAPHKAKQGKAFEPLGTPGGSLAFGLLDRGVPCRAMWCVEVVTRGVAPCRA